LAWQVGEASRLVGVDQEGDSVRSPETHAVLDEVNQQTGAGWQLGDHLEGGYQSGAWRVFDGERTAVVKWWDRPSWAPRVLQAAPLVEAVIAAGYPTPRWLAVGTTSQGFPFEVQELVQGSASEHAVHAPVLLDLIHLQQSIRLETAVDWTAYMRNAVFDEPDEHQARVMAAGGMARDVVLLAREVAAPHVDCEIRDDEMVHGDFSLSNILLHEGRVSGVVDIEAIGRGCAVFDLLTPVRQGYCWGGDPAAVEMWESEALRTYGPGAVAIAAACHAINILSFGLDKWPDTVQDVAQRCHGWLVKVGKAC
jgi:hypothetical protein